MEPLKNNILVEKDPNYSTFVLHLMLYIYIKTIVLWIQIVQPLSYT